MLNTVLYRIWPVQDCSFAFLASPGLSFHPFDQSGTVLSPFRLVRDCPGLSFHPFDQSGTVLSPFRLVWDCPFDGRTILCGFRSVRHRKFVYSYLRLPHRLGHFLDALWWKGKDLVFQVDELEHL